MNKYITLNENGCEILTIETNICINAVYKLQKTSQML